MLKVVGPKSRIRSLEALREFREAHEKIKVPDTISEDVFALLSAIDDDRKEPLNNAVCTYLEGLSSFGEKELIGLFRIAAEHGSPKLREKLETKFYVDGGRVVLRRFGDKPSSYGGFIWPETDED